MKKLASVILVLLLLAACILPAAADVLWEPYENKYYTSRGHDNFTGVDRIYVVPDGMTVNMYESPKRSSLLTTMEAGTRVYVGFSTTVKGEVWGVGYPLGDWKTEGWFRLGRLQLEYDHESFMADHGDEVESKAVSIPGSEITGPVQTWTYPGSGISDGVLDLKWAELTYNNGELRCNPVYTDPNGGQWGYVGYFMGPYGWIYLDDLYTETPPTFPGAAPSTVTDTAPTEDAPAPALAWVYILVAAVVVITAAVIVIFKRRQKAG